jgi:hypothetical protein
MPKRKPKQSKTSRPPKQVSKLPPNADDDPAGPRLLPLPDDKRRPAIHPQIDSFVDLADSALKLWDKKKQG